MNNEKSLSGLKFRQLAWAFSFAVALQLLAASARAQQYAYYVPVGTCLAACANLAPGGQFVQAPDGTFYGTGFIGANGSGAMFSFKPVAGTLAPLTVIYTFSPLQGGGSGAPEINSDGGNPYGLTLGSDGNLYGATSIGGANGSGTIFKVTTAGVLTTIYTFTATSAGGVNADGYSPQGTLVQATDGSFYGTARFGGPAGTGTVFRITPGGSFSVIHSFPPMDANDANTDGAQPESGLVFGTDGNLYGTASLGGANGVGTIFSLSTGGAFTLLHTLVRATDGANPSESLVQATDGDFYGTAQNGGADGWGTIFRISAAGQFSVLYQFGTISPDFNLDDDGQVNGPLWQGPDGNFYGTTGTGYPGCGTVFGLTPAGSYSILFEFNDGCGPNDRVAIGAPTHPTSGLVRGNDGIVYGLSDNSLAGSDSGSVYELQFSSTPLLTLTATPTAAVTGQPITYSWTSDLGGCSNVDGSPLPADGSLVVDAPSYEPHPYTSFFIQCRTTLGEGTAYTVVDLLPPPPTATLTANPASLTLGTGTTLTWSTTDATSCNATGAWSGGLNVPSGTQTEIPSQAGSYTYTMECSGPGGNVSASASVSVSAATQSAPPPAKGGGGGGGGAISPFSILVLTWMVALRRLAFRQCDAGALQKPSSGA